MRLPILLMGLVMCVGSAFAEDAQKLVERRTCTDIKAEIDMLSAVENPDDATRENLKQLQAQYRSSCMPKSTGRRTIARSIPTIAGSKAGEGISAAVVATSDALSEYLASKKSNCDKLNSEIEKLVAKGDEAKSDALASMRGLYEMDCVAKTDNAPELEQPTAQEQTDEEWAAEYDANLAAGLCGDGTKPNKFGCCTGETFKDLGDSLFACCPKAGGICFPPIK